MDGSNIQSIVLIILIIGVAVFGYIEIQRLKASISNLEKIVNSKPTSNHLSQPPLPLRETSFIHRFNPPEPMKSEIIAEENAISSMNIGEETPTIIKYDPPSIENTTNQTADEELTQLMMSDDEDHIDNYDLQYRINEPDIEDTPKNDVTPKNDDINENDTNIPNDTKDPGETKDIIPSDEIKESTYSSKTVSELKSILTEMNQPVSGNKTKLIKRIQENIVVNKV